MALQLDGKGRFPVSIVHMWYERRLARRRHEAEQNLARVQATIHSRGMNALKSTPEQIAEAQRWAPDMRAKLAQIKFLEYETWGEYREEDGAEWTLWKQVRWLSQCTNCDLDDPC